MNPDPAPERPWLSRIVWGGLIVYVIVVWAGLIVIAARLVFNQEGHQ